MDKKSELENKISNDVMKKTCEFRNGSTKKWKYSMDQIKIEEDKCWDHFLTKYQNQKPIMCNKKINDMDSFVGSTNENTKFERKRIVGCTYFDDHILAHANVPQQMLSSIEQAYFTENIEHVFQQINGPYISPTQSIAWPHLLNGNSLILVDSKCANRSWCYLPVICTLVERTMKQASNAHVGPIAVIMVATPVDAHILHSVCITLLNSECLDENGIVVASCDQSNSEVCMKLSQGCGILITTQHYLELLLLQNTSECLFDFEYLKHIVIDDFDLLNSFNPDEFQKLLGNLLRLCFVKTKNKFIKQQLIVTTQFWDRQLLPVLLRSVQHPLLIFGDFLEAIVYGSVNLKIWATKSEERRTVLLELVEERFNATTRAIIFCNTNEQVTELDALLRTAGYDCFIGSDSEEFCKELSLWKTKINNKILICTDQIQALEIHNANHIIHYNLPNCRERFKLRHSTIVADYRNWLNDSTFPVSPLHKVDVLVDECDNFEEHLLIELLLKQKETINPNLLQTLKDNQLCKRKRPANLYYTLCPNLTLFGICNLVKCDRRHCLLPIDVLNESHLKFIPKTGIIEIEIVEVYTPTHYAVRLLTHKAAKEDEWRIKLTTFDDISKDLKYYYSNPLNHKRYWPPKVGEICVCKMDEEYLRIRILELAENSKIWQPNNCSVIAEFLDKITGVFSFKWQYLLICPEQYIKIPPLIIDIHLTAVVPARYETQNAIEIIKSRLHTKCATDTLHLEAYIDYAMTHTIFVSNIFVNQSSLTHSTCLVNILQWLLECKIAYFDKEASLRLNEIFEEVEKLATH